MQRSCRATGGCARLGWRVAKSGEPGENAVRRADGRIEKLQGCDATTIEAGGTIIIKTPTGGGYGEPAK
jgi:5-oxoprolinase (ATP-hydrolysing)